MNKITKRFFKAAAVSVLAALAVSGTPCFAEAGTDSTLNLLNTPFQAVQSENFTTTLYFEEGSNIADLRLSLSFDSGLAELVDYRVCNNKTIANVNESEGEINITYSSTDHSAERFDVIELTFKTNDFLAHGSYDFLKFNADTVCEAGTYEGDTNKITDKAVINAVEKLVIYQSGDADLNGQVQARDVTRIKQHVVNITKLNEEALPYANANVDFLEDGSPKINSRDAVLIQQKIVKMDVTLGGRSTVTFLDKDGKVYDVKSVKNGSALTSLPSVPVVDGYESGSWSSVGDSLVAPDFSNVSGDMTIHAYYDLNEENIKNKEIYDKFSKILNEVFIEEDKYITNNFQLPYKSKDGSFNLPTSDEFKDVDVIWTVNSGLATESVSINNYIVTIPRFDYTTFVKFTATILISGDSYGTCEFERPIKGLIDLPDSSNLDTVINAIPLTLSDNYRLPGIISLETQRLESMDFESGKTVKNVEIKWSVIEGDAKCLDTAKNQICYLNEENNVIFRADFYLNGHSFYSKDISRKIPAKSYEDQVKYAKKFLESSVPSLFTGETLLPTKIELYDLTFEWFTDLPEGKLTFGERLEFNNEFYATARLGEEAGYLEQSHIMVRVERKGDSSFEKFEQEFAIQLAGASSVITDEKVVDPVLYAAMLKYFDADDDGILTEEEVCDPGVAMQKNYTIDLSIDGMRWGNDSPFSGVPIKNLAGIEYLRNFRVIDLSGNDLSGTNANLGRLGEIENLVQLNLSCCQISEIPASVFASKSRIEGIDLSHNYLKNLDFLKLERGVPFMALTDMLLHENYITDISSLSYVDGTGKTVSRVPNVKRLTLTRDLAYITTDEDIENGFDINATLDIEPIRYMTKLTTLWLGNNNIDNISPLSTCHLISTLDLSCNNIISTHNDQGLAPLSNLLALVCLKLDNNKITTLTGLRGLTYLQVLSLSNNTITNSDIVQSLPNLYYLDLDGNSLTSFKIGKLVNLRFLYLERNDLTSVTMLETAPHLTELRLNYNNLDLTEGNGDVCRNSISTLSELRYLSLNGNTIGSIEFLKPLTTLTHLEIASCNVYETVLASESGEDFIFVDNLTYLSDMKSLLVLDISGNPVRDLTPISALNALEVLYADRVKALSGAPLSLLTNLKYLTMQDSGLSDLSFIKPLGSICYLNLSGHMASTFSYEYLTNIMNSDQIKALFLDSALPSTEVNTYIGEGKNKENIHLEFSRNLRYFSAANMTLNSMENVPLMNGVYYLGLRNTGINDFRGPFDESDGYQYSIDFCDGEDEYNCTRFPSLRYLDVADNPDLFTKPNLELLFAFTQRKNRSILLYSNDAPENYVPGYMKSEIEAKYLTSFLDFGDASVDISAALNAGYELPTTLNGYDITWDIEENEDYYVEDGKLYFKDTAKTPEATIALKMNVHGLYAKAGVEPPAQSVTFNASIKSTYGTQMVENGTRTDTCTAYTSTLDGWTLTGSEPGGYTDWSGWSDWSPEFVSTTPLCEVREETREISAKQYLVTYYCYKRTSDGRREYRNASINGNFAGNGFSTTYGENPKTASIVQVTQAQIDAAPVVPSGAYADASYGMANYPGYNGTDQNGYVLNLSGDFVIWYIVGEVPGETQKVYSYRTRSEIPAKYFFERQVPVYVEEPVLEGLSLVAEYKSGAQIEAEKALEEENNETPDDGTEILPEEGTENTQENPVPDVNPGGSDEENT